jgi:hypothetical protein
MLIHCTLQIGAVRDAEPEGDAAGKLCLTARKPAEFEVRLGGRQATRIPPGPYVVAISYTPARLHVRAVYLGARLAAGLLGCWR